MDPDHHSYILWSNLLRASTALQGFLMFRAGSGFIITTFKYFQDPDPEVNILWIQILTIILCGLTFFGRVQLSMAFYYAGPALTSSRPDLNFIYVI